MTGTAESDGGTALPGLTSVEKLRDAPQRFSGSAGQNLRKSLAKRFDLIALERFDFTLETRPWRSGVLIEGTISAEVVQSCVVTLEPVTTSLNDSFRAGYLPEDELYAEMKPAAEMEIAVDGELGDIPELLNDPMDLGEIITENLSLALPEYPRQETEAPVVATAAPVGAEPLTDEKVKPFAALEALKARLEGGGEG